ncbi:GLPGLI family protein [Chryseobacterium sp. OV279]|nr:GLPGLI family protein [Chryseobacterium sp. OV279]
MKNKIFLFLSVLMLVFTRSQNLHIKYTYVNPVNFLINEDLYVSGNYALSIRDSVMLKKEKNQLKVEGNNVEILGKVTKQKTKYYKTSLNETLIINEFIGENSYWISDQLPKIVWNTNFVETKKIGKYVCKKATAVFRGSKVAAYYALDLPFSFGPYKFSGLPGVILEVTEDEKSVNSWKADLIESYVSKKIELMAPKNNTISYKEFIHLQENKDLEEVKRLTSNLPRGAVVHIDSPKRNGIEKKYEWEE